ncbi:DUF6355 family natural product biosynthesis protein [Longispora urticae]
MTKHGAILSGAVLLGAALTAMAPTAAVAAPTDASAPASARIQVCGFYETHSTAYYNHCGDAPIWIVVDYASGPNQYRQICGRGVTDIGGAGAVDNAWYSHPAPAC